jgi:hypothetical protein
MESNPERRRYAWTQRSLQGLGKRGCRCSGARLHLFTFKPASPYELHISTADQQPWDFGLNGASSSVQSLVPMIHAPQFAGLRPRLANTKDVFSTWLFLRMIDLLMPCLVFAGSWDVGWMSTALSKIQMQPRLVPLSRQT